VLRFAGRMNRYRLKYAVWFARGGLRGLTYGTHAHSERGGTAAYGWGAANRLQDAGVAVRVVCGANHLVDHGVNAHDLLCNAAAGALVKAAPGFAAGCITHARSPIF
jgi:hypothetical protein